MKKSINDNGLENSISFRSVQYLAITQNWKINLENFDNESKFLHLLFEDYFVNFFSKFFTVQLNGLEAKLSALEKRADLLKNECNGQLLMLNMMIEGKVKENADYLKKKQINLEMKINGFNRIFIDLKKEIYHLVKSASDCHERFSYATIDKLV